jgi:Fe-S-cluster containining protein
MKNEVLQNIILSGIYLLQDNNLLTDILEYQEEINKDVEELLKKEPFACEKGCYFCCTGWDVKGTIPEALLFVKGLNSLEVEKRRWLNKKLENYRGTQKSEDTLCPFLENGLCISYKGRPFVCRTYSSYDKTLCENKKSFEFPPVVEKALEIVDKKVSILEEPFKTLFETKIPFSQISFDKKRQLFYINLGDTAHIYPQEEGFLIEKGLYAKKYMP